MPSQAEEAACVYERQAAPPAGPSGRVDTAVAAKLAVALGRCTNDNELFRVAAEACYQLAGGVCHVSVAILSHKEDVLYYFKLNREQSGTHEHIGSLVLARSAAGTVVRLKRLVYQQDVGTSGQRWVDQQHFHTRYGAHAVVSAPLVVAEKVLGVLNVGSAQQDAFQGRLKVVETVAAVIAPLVGVQRFRRELKSTENLLQRMLPPHVIDRLHEMQAPVGIAQPADEFVYGRMMHAEGRPHDGAVQHAAQQAQQAAQRDAPQNTAGTSTPLQSLAARSQAAVREPANVAGAGSSSTATAAWSERPVPAPSPRDDRSTAAAPAVHGSHQQRPASAPFATLRPALPRQQLAATPPGGYAPHPAYTPAAHHPAYTPVPKQAPKPHVSEWEAQQWVKPLHRRWMMTFDGQYSEDRFRAWGLSLWTLGLDACITLITLFSLFGMTQGIVSRHGEGGVPLVWSFVAAVLMVWPFAMLLNEPKAYVHHREQLMTGVRLLRTLLFVLNALLDMGNPWLLRQVAATNMFQAVVYSGSLMLGAQVVFSQMRMIVHLPVHLANTLLLMAATVHFHWADAQALPAMLTAQAVFGLALPTMGLFVLERNSRVRFSAILFKEA